MKNADSSTNTKKILLVRQNLPKKIHFFFAWQLYTNYEQKFANLRPPLFLTFPQGFQKSKKFGHWTLGSGGKKLFKRGEQMIFFSKKLFCRCNFTTIMSKRFQIWDHFLSLLFPEDFKNLKSLHIGLWETRAKRPLKRVRNLNTRKSCLVR